MQSNSQSFEPIFRRHRAVLLGAVARVLLHALQHDRRVEDARRPHQRIVERRLPRLPQQGGEVDAVGRQRLQQRVLQGARRDRAADGGRAPALRLHDEVAERAHAQRAHPLLQVLHVLRQPSVAARPQQVGTGRDGREAERRAVREVAAVDAGRERDRHVRPLAAPAVHQVQRDHVQRLARQVHHRFRRREERAVVADDQRVRELHLEGAAERARQLRQAVGDLERLAPLQVLLEVLRARPDLLVPEQPVQDAVDRLAAEQGRVELDR
jgi:hypothetical protein